MSTTTIRQPAELEARIAAAAKRAGTTAHGFILEAIAEKAELEERRADFNRVAGERFTRQPRAAALPPPIHRQRAPRRRSPACGHRESGRCARRSG